MTLFTFTLHGELFALPGEAVRQVVVPEPVQGFVMEEDGRFARHGGDRVAIVRVPGQARDAAGVFLRVSMDGSQDGFLGIDSAAGLVEVAEDQVLDLPRFLFEENRPPYSGLFRLGDRIGALLSAAALTERAPGLEC